MTIVEFLDARIAEDEEVARAASAESWRATAIASPHWRYDGGQVYNSAYAITSDDRELEEMYGLHMARHDPARVLRECAAKRAIIASLVPAEGGVGRTWAPGSLEVLAALVTIYSDHPDYQTTWSV